MAAKLEVELAKAAAAAKAAPAPAKVLAATIKQGAKTERISLAKKRCGFDGLPAFPLIVDCQRQLFLDYFVSHTLVVSMCFCISVI